MTIRRVVDGQAGLPSPNPTRSYWHTEPSSVLLGHRTTPELPATADIVVIGSGITGSFAAHFLKNGGAKNASVLMLEAREACWGATGRNGGHCQPLLYSSTPEVARFELDTYSFLQDFIREHQVPCDWTSLRGCHAYLSEDLFGAAQASVAKLHKLDPELAAQVEVIESSRLRQDETKTATTLSSLRIPDAHGAVVQKNAASLWPYKLVAYVLEQLLGHFPAGAFNLQTRTPVTSLHRRHDTTDAASASSRPWLLSTPRGRIAARTVLLCTNAYTSRLLPSFADLIVPVRGQVAALLLPPLPPSARQAVPPIQLACSYVFAGPGAETPAGRALGRDEYLVQRPVTASAGGELIFGGGRDHARAPAVGEWRDDVVDDDVGRYLRRNVSPPLDLSSDGPRMRGGSELDATMEWTGIMGFSRDQHPWVGPVPESMGGGGKDGGLWVCGGYSGHGMPAAALCARAVARSITGEEATGAQSGEVVLPAAFVLNEERIAHAREKLETVKESDRRGGTTVFSSLRVSVPPF